MSSLQLETPCHVLMSSTSNTIKAPTAFSQFTLMHQYRDSDDGRPSGKSGEQMKEYRLKVIVVGNLNSGKTSIIKRFVNNYFSRSYKATVGVDFALKVIDVDPHTRVHLQLWDVAGQERFGSMTRIYYKNAVGAFIVFDVDDIKTWQGVSNWRDDIKEKLYPEEDIPILLIGNKSDLLHDRSPCVPFEEMEDFTKKKIISLGGS